MFIWSGPQLQDPVAGISKQETVAKFLTFFVRILEGLMGQDVPLPHLAKLWFTGNAARLPSCQDTCPYFCPCVTYHIWMGVGWGGGTCYCLVCMYCCQQSRAAQWPSLMSLLRVEKFVYKWGEGIGVAEQVGFVMKENQYYTNTLKETQQKMLLSLSSRIRMPERMKPCSAEHFCFWNLTRFNGNLQTLVDSPWETFS